MDFSLRLKKRAIDSIALLSLWTSTVYQKKASEKFIEDLSALPIEDFKVYTTDLITCFGRSVDKAMKEEYKYIAFPGIGSFRRSDIRRAIVEFKKASDETVTKDDIKRIIKEQVEYQKLAAIEKSNGAKPIVIDLSKRFNETQENNL